jgi:hypothetical protein
MRAAPPDAAPAAGDGKNRPRRPGPDRERGPGISRSKKTVREHCPGKDPKKRRTRKTVWRRGRDSNPGSPFLRTHLISNQALSAAQPPLRPCQKSQRSPPAYRGRARDSPAWWTAKNSKSLVHRQARRPVPGIKRDYSRQWKKVTGNRLWRRESGSDPPALIAPDIPESPHRTRQGTNRSRPLPIADGVRRGPQR